MAHCHGLLWLSKSILLDLQLESTVFNYFRIRQKVSALCNQAEEDLVEFEGCRPGDKGTEVGVFGKKGLAELCEFATHGSIKGYARVDASQPTWEDPKLFTY